MGDVLRHGQGGEMQEQNGKEQVSDGFYFADLNSPGALYFGTEAHMNGLTEQGGHPSKVDVEVHGNNLDDLEIGGEANMKIDGETEKWTVQAAPDFWAEEG